MRWRWSERQTKFAREVGSVVLGVLIALGIGEVADAVRWRFRVASSLSAIRIESAGNRFNLVERRLLAGCIDRRLVEIDGVLDRASRSGRLPAIGAFGRPPIRSIETAAYDVAIGEGAPLHMDRGQARDIALVYILGALKWGELIDREQAAWDTLAILEQREGPIGDDLLAALIQAQAQAKAVSALIVSLADSGNQLFEELDIPVEYLTQKDLPGLVSQARRRQVCRPLVVGARA